MFNYSKNFVIRQLRSISIANLLKIPVYEGSKVHFGDTLKQLIKNAFDSIGEEYLPSELIQGKIELKWTRNWRKIVSTKKKMIESLDFFMAGTLLYDKYNIIKSNKNDR